MAASSAGSTLPAETPFAVVWRRVEDLQSDPRNLRRYSNKQVRRLAKSIDAFGFNVPILIDRGLRIVAGHARLLGAQELGWSAVPTILTDHLSAAQAHVFVIADNRLGEAASWDDLLLAMQLKELSAAEAEPASRLAQPYAVRSIWGSALSVSRISSAIGLAPPQAMRPDPRPASEARELRSEDPLTRSSIAQTARRAC